MKKIFENWKKFLIEDMYEPKVYTFDFDNTIMMTRPDEDWGEVVDGPNQKIIKLMHEYDQNGDRVIIVTSRHEKQEHSQWYDRDHPAYMPSVSEYVQKYDLPVDGVVFTNGDLKANKLIELRSDLHYDDDEEEIAAAKESGIKVVQVRNMHYSQAPEEEQ